MASAGDKVTVAGSGVLYPPDPTALALASAKFDSTAELVESTVNTLTTYLTEFDQVLASSVVSSVAPQATVIDTALNLEQVGSRPEFTESLGTFPSESYTAPTLASLPVVDASIIAQEAPADIDPTITWTESELSTDVYTDLLARVQQDLVAGATGLSEDVENAIIARGQARLVTAKTSAYTKLNADVTGRHLSCPGSVLSSALSDYYSEELRQDADLNNNLIVTSYDAAQKNSQFIIAQSVALEGLIRTTRDGVSSRALDFAKAQAANIIATYSEAVKKYLAHYEGARAYILAQVENLKAVAEGERLKVDLYKEQYAALAVEIDAVARKNKAISDVYLAEVSGFEAEARAKAQNNTNLIEHLRAKIAESDLRVRAHIADAQNETQEYVAIRQLAEKIVNDKSLIAATLVSAALGSVHVNAGVNSGSSINVAESTTHHDSISETYSHTFATEGA